MPFGLAPVAYIRRFVLLATSVAASFLPLGCTMTAVPAGIPVSIQLSWTHDFQFAPFYVADQMGYFKAEGLVALLKQGGFHDGTFINTVNDVVAGSVDFGLVDAYSVLIARSEGKQDVAIAAIYQRSPASLLSLRDRNITRPQDLIGKRVALTKGSVTWTNEAMLKSQGIGLDQVQLVPRTSTSIEPLLRGEVDAMSGWIVNEGVEIKEAGLESSSIIMGDYGTDTCPTALFTTEKLLEERSDVAERFVHALQRGLADTLNRPDFAVSATQKHNDALGRDGQSRRLQASLPLLRLPGSKPGSMTAGMWETTYDVPVTEHVLTKPLEIEAAYGLKYAGN